MKALSQKFHFTSFILLSIFTLSCDNGTSGVSNICKDTNCANYSSQSAAQADYDADPECRGDLDADNDGIACEEPGNSVKDCATTSNCGCSNYRKDECPTDPCCQWVVGDGCNCK